MSYRKQLTTVQEQAASNVSGRCSQGACTLCAVAASVASNKRNSSAEEKGLVSWTKRTHSLIEQLDHCPGLMNDSYADTDQITG